ncbi:MAG: 3'-5' exonuclease [Bacteroidales bacterium]|nr:3'-5' exonuclease [Bacteroidales bacterium]
MPDFIKELNEAQQRAVTTTGGPVMVIAGAGSGKTRVLTYRVAYLLQQGVSPFRILALTFTNKAAREMRERVATLIDPSKAKSLWMGTFHSIFARILRAEASKLGYPSQFSIYDTEDSKRVIKKILKEQNIDDKTYAPGFVLHRISNAKNNLISAADYNEDVEIQSEDVQMRKPKLGLIYSLYQQKLRNASAMDFDDLLFNTNVLLRDFPDVLYKYQQRFEYILVDEYQDTNFSQYLIVKKLAANNENICVVGDDAQSIYAFRGANIRNILNFKNDYPDYQLFKLEQNYRSTRHIVSVANSLIEHNKQKIHKKVWTSNEAGEKIQIISTATEGEEASWVASRIFELIQQKRLPNSAFAVLYRTNAQSRALEEALRRLNIKYRIYGSVSFYQRKEIKDVLSYFRLVINPHDEDALLRIINFPTRGIGNTTLNKLIVAANEAGTPLWNVCRDPGAFNVQLHSGALTKLSEFVLLIKSFAARLYKLNAYELGELIINKSGIRRLYFEDGSPESINRRDNIEELLSGLKDFSQQPEQHGNIFTGEAPLPGEAMDSPGESEAEQMPDAANGIFRTLDEFMQDIALLTDADSESENKDDRNAVSLMTVHASKGLEFPYVFITGMEENLFPSQLSINSEAELEEERRLFYVALTRAMKQAWIVYAETRFRYGNFNMCEPSRFLDELDEHLVDHILPGRKGRKKISTTESFAESIKKYRKLSTFDSVESASPAPAADDSSGYGIIDPALLQVDMQVKHQRFGLGRIVSIELAGQNSRATVAFNAAGKKQLLLKYARLKILR